jgi:hypothetical protein
MSSIEGKRFARRERKRLSIILKRLVMPWP